MSKKRWGFHITSVTSELVNQSEACPRRPHSHDALGPRFRVVRLDTRGRYMRGRWTCLDLPTATTEVRGLGAGLRRVMMIDSQRQALSLESLELMEQGCEKGAELVHNTDHIPRQNKLRPVLPDAQMWRQCRSQPSSPPHSPAPSSSSGSSIDKKIEQALELVKIHVRTAVQDEVSVLRETIRDLENRNLLLQQENLILRSVTGSKPGLNQV
ncbi:unnamed protein product [Knipowitschia caucasica]